MLPDPIRLLAFTREWVNTAGGEQVAFYSAEEAPEGLEEEVAPTPKAKAKAKAAEKAKRPSAAHGRAHNSYEQDVAPDVQPVVSHAGGAAEAAEIGRAKCSCPTTEGFTDACLHAPPIFCKDDGLAPEDEACGAAITASEGQPVRPSRSPVGGRGATSSAWGRHFGASRPSAISGIDITGSTSPAGRRSSAGPSGHCIFNFFKRGGRSRKAAKGACTTDRGIFPPGDAECIPSDEAGQSAASQYCRSCGNRLFYDTILGTLRRIRKCKRAGDHPICTGFCGRCCNEGRHGRRPRAPLIGDGGHRASSSGPEQVGPGVPADASGRSSSSDLFLQHLNIPHHGPSQGFLSLVSSAVGHSGAGFCKGDGLHTVQETRDRKGPFSVATAGQSCSVRTSQPKEKIPKGEGCTKPEQS